mgnify:CR=1 FL=1
MEEKMDTMQRKYETTVGALQDAMRNIAHFRKTLNEHTNGRQKAEVQRFLTTIFGTEEDIVEEEDNTEGITNRNINNLLGPEYQIITYYNHEKRTHAIILGVTQTENQSDNEEGTIASDKNEEEEEMINEETVTRSQGSRDNSQPLFENNDSWDTSTVKGQEVQNGKGQNSTVTR